ncbi:GFA family protein [Phyllobacterium phragmitis]|uniref:GFA family protein n=1 Tax=Phyllobacterium phragmitis TaxID=2670329 RepID=UPI001FE0FC7C|nr:GFA family protein [Phyllobacterium phragmitis]
MRFETTGKLGRVSYCHCTQCRKQSGHHYAATNVVDDALHIDGAENITWYASSEKARRGFCRTCGSVLFWKHDEVDYTSIMAGSFDQPTGLHGKRHIFVSDKGDYYSINDELPQYPQG